MTDHTNSPKEKIGDVHHHKHFCTRQSSWNLPNKNQEHFATGKLRKRHWNHLHHKKIGGVSHQERTWQKYQQKECCGSWLVHHPHHHHHNYWQRHHNHYLGLNSVKHLIGKGDKLHALVNGATFWQGEESIYAGLVVWKVTARPVVEYGSEVWVCSSEYN